MYISHFSIRRPVAATMLISMLVVFGVIGMSRLGVALFPNVDYPIVTVSTDWRNARPEEVDNEITDRLEDAVSGISGIKHITSQSMQGRSRITIEFELNKDVDIAAQEVRDKISTRQRDLPEEAEVPIIEKQDINASPIMFLAVTGPYPVEVLTKVADELLRPMVQKIEGVGAVEVRGGREREIHVRLYRERLAAYELGVNEVINAIRNQHIDIPGGKIESQKQEYVIRTMGEFETAQQFNELIVATRKGTPIRVKDIGYAVASREEGRPGAKFTTQTTSERAVGLSITPRSGANDVAIARAVKKLLPELENLLYEGMSLHIATDRSLFIEQSINEVKTHLILGGILAALVIFLFLQNFRTTLISAVSIPTSIISTFACMYMMGFTMNNMTMLALAVSVGIVIDDAIVMVENIFRHRSALQKDAVKAAFDASHEIGFAIIATTCVLGGVFLPVAFMGGMIGRFFYEFSITLAFAIACSSLVALTVVPMLCSRFLKVGYSDWLVFRVFEYLMEAVTAVYRRSITVFLRHRLLMVLLSLAALGAGGWMYFIIGKEFITEEDQGRFSLRMQLPLSYSVEKGDEIMDRVLEVLRSIPEMQHAFSFSGTGGFAFVTLVPKSERERPQLAIQSEVRNRVRMIPDLRASVTSTSPLGGRARNEPVQFVLQGPSIEEIDHYSKLIMDRLESLPGYVGVNRDLEIGKPELRVIIDREKAADAGIQTRDIASAVGALIGGTDVAEFKEGGKSYDIWLRLDREERELPGDLERIWVRAANGTLMDIRNFVRLEQGVGPSVINRLDRQRSATIYANLEGKVMGDALEEVSAIADDVLPDYFATKLAGQAESFMEAGQHIWFVFILAVILTYMILAAQFESFVFPFSIMMGLPLSFLGAFGLLLLLGNTLNMYSMIGLVLLVGLAAKNGILLVEYTNQLRAKGMNVHDALVEAGTVRLRPILMTAISTVAGVIPVVLGIGEGSESRQPMGVAISGGIISSTFLTLGVVPVVYSYLDQFAHWRLFDIIKRKIMVSPAESSLPVENSPGA